MPRFVIVAAALAQTAAAGYTGAVDVRICSSASTTDCDTNAATTCVTHLVSGCVPAPVTALAALTYDAQGLAGITSLNGGCTPAGVPFLFAHATSSDCTSPAIHIKPASANGQVAANTCTAITGIGGPVPPTSQPTANPSANPTTRKPTLGGTSEYPTSAPSPLTSKPTVRPTSSPTFLSVQWRSAKLSCVSGAGSAHASMVMVGSLLMLAGLRI